MRIFPVVQPGCGDNDFSPGHIGLHVPGPDLSKTIAFPESDSLRFPGWRCDVPRWRFKTQETAMKKPQLITYDGKVVRVDGDLLMTTSNEGKHTTHTVARETKITLGGRAGNLAELRSGVHVRLTMRSDAPETVTSVESGARVC
jgi:hypothetical protein